MLAMMQNDSIDSGYGRPQDHWGQAANNTGGGEALLANHPLFGNGGSALPANIMDEDDDRVAAVEDPNRFAAADDDEDDDDAAHAVAARTIENLSRLAGPASQSYTEAASSHSTLQPASDESLLGIRTEDQTGFWSHRVNPPTPTRQRTAAVPGESPTNLVEGVVRAGLETPNRPVGFGMATTPQNQYAATNEGSSSSAFSGNSNMGASSTVLGNDVRSTAQGQRYRTVQQYISERHHHGHHGHQSGASSRPGAAAHRFSDTTTPIVILEFKMDRRCRFRCPVELAEAVAPDQWVVVELDNGSIDMGACIEVYRGDRKSIPAEFGHGESGVVLRLSTEQDCEILNDVIPRREAEALTAAHQLVHFLHMPFTCIDAEFQFDLKCVTLYYELTPQAYTSIIPNVGRLQRELGFKLKASVLLQQLVAVES